MALALDATSTAVATFDGTTTTWSHTCSGSDRVLYVLVQLYCASGTQATGVTYNGVALTKIADSARSSGGDYAQLWRLIAPATGANNVVVTYPASNNNTGSVAAISFTGADQTTPNGTIQATTGSSTAPSVTVTSASGEICIVGCAWDASSATGTTGASQTSFLLTTAGGEGSAASYEAGAASVVLNYTLSVSATWGIAGVSVKPAGGAAAASFLESRPRMPQAILAR